MFRLSLSLLLLLILLWLMLILILIRLLLVLLVKALLMYFSLLVLLHLDQINQHRINHQQNTDRVAQDRQIQPLIQAVL